MHRHVVGTLIVVLILGGGCAARSAGRGQGAKTQGYHLVYPPDVPDKGYPGGVHVQAAAPLTAWHEVAVFATHEKCEASRITRIDESIDKARAEVGDQAKYQLPVRRAVQARCVSAQ
jgi:hypothetical protein